MRIGRPITPSVFCGLKSMERGHCLALPGMLVQSGLARGADPSPASNQNDFAKQIPLHLERVEPGHVPPGVDLTQDDRPRTRTIWDRCKVGCMPGDVSTCLEEGKGQLAHGRRLAGEARTLTQETVN
jgi:hypothetical protein